jgi:hypothetical protein
MKQMIVFPGEYLTCDRRERLLIGCVSPPTLCQQQHITASTSVRCSLPFTHAKIQTGCKRK